MKKFLCLISLLCAVSLPALSIASFLLGAAGTSVTYSTVDKCTGGTASAENVYTTYVASYAFNDSTAYNSWWTSTTKPAWIQYDFGSGVSWAIARVRIFPNGLGTNQNWCQTVAIEGSNNESDWDTLVAESAALTKEEWNNVDFSNSTAYRYIRVDGLTSTKASNISIKEIEMVVEE